MYQVILRLRYSLWLLKLLCVIRLLKDQRKILNQQEALGFYRRNQKQVKG